MGSSATSYAAPQQVYRDSQFMELRDVSHEFQEALDVGFFETDTQLPLSKRADAGRLGEVEKGSRKGRGKVVPRTLPPKKPAAPNRRGN